MPKYPVDATFAVSLSYDIEAEDREEAEDKAREIPTTYEIEEIQELLNEPEIGEEV